VVNKLLAIRNPRSHCTKIPDSGSSPPYRATKEREFNSDRWLGIEAGHDEPDIEPMMPLESARSQLMVRITAGPVVPYA
jgi:hypothetical protein